MPATSRENAKARFTRELINVVNPRLVLYTRAGVLAAIIILLLNYGVIAALASVLMEFCTEITAVEHSQPTSRGDHLAHMEFINRTLEREGVVSPGAVTVSTSLDGCARRSTATMVAPHPRSWDWSTVDIANQSTVRTDQEKLGAAPTGTQTALSMPRGATAPRAQSAQRCMRAKP